MPIYKTNLLFEDQGQGWSETYYSEQLSIPAAYQAALVLRTARANLLAEPATIQYIRIAEDGVFRASQLFAADPMTAWNYPADRSDKPYMAGLMNCYNTPGAYSRPLYLRGNPDLSFDLKDPNNANAQAWRQWMVLFGQFLAASSATWAIKVRPRVDLGVNTVDITGFATTAQSKYSLVSVGAAHGLSKNAQVTLYRMAGLPFPPSLCRVVAVPSATTFVIPYRCPADYVYNGAGYYVEYAPAYKKIDSFAFERFTKRSTGRPFGLSRGRRRSIAR